MRDLRRQALESGKTVSKKAQSKISSRASSAANSRTNSRTVSRNVSDDEEGDLSDSTTWSINSIDELLQPEIPDDPEETWKLELGDRIEEIVDRKRSSVQGREATLVAFNHILMQRYTHDDLESKMDELLPALLKSVKLESSEKESSLALKAIGLVLITVPNDNSYDALQAVLKRTYSSSQHTTVKAAAVHVLTVGAIYGGASDEAIEDIMDELLEIIESDGASIEATDDGAIVTAAIEAWGYLATMIDDLEEKTESAMEAFVEQLDSSDASVQIAAGENIALIYEKSWTPREADDGPAALEHDDEGHELDNSYVKRYEAYRQKNQLEHKLLQLSKEPSRRLAKKDRKQLHTSFADILTTIEHPPRGPRYSKAISDTSGRRYGSRLYIRMGTHGVGIINKWWKLHRLHALRRILGSGFTVHYELNEVVLESLPVIFSRAKHSDL